MRLRVEALAINVNGGHTDASLGDGAVLRSREATLDPDTAVGALTVHANNATTTLALATPKAEPASGKSLGLGLSFAINVADADTRTAMDPGAAVRGADDVLAQAGGDDVTFDADADHQMATLAKAGAKAGSQGTAVGGAVAIAVATNDTASEVQAGDATIELDGNLLVTATALSAMRTEADADTKGADTGFGAAIALGWMESDTRTALDRSVFSPAANAPRANAITVSAVSGGTVATLASGSSTGNKTDGESSDDATAKQTGVAQDKSGQKDLTALKAGEQVNDANQTAAGQTANTGGQGGTTQAAGSQQQGGTVRIAGAIAGSVVRPDVSARIGPDVRVDNAGALQVRAVSDADAVTLATGLAYDDKGGEKGIAAAVAINVADLSNTATVGSNSEITAGSVSVEAGTTAGQVNGFQNIALAGGGAVQKGQGSQSNMAAGAGAAGINVVTSTTRAELMDGSKVTSSAGNVDVLARRDVGVQNIVGGGALVSSSSGDGKSVGLAIVFNRIDAEADARIGAGTEVSVTGGNLRAIADTSVRAPALPIPSLPLIGTLDLSASNIVVGAAVTGSDGWAGAGSAVVNWIDSRTHASVGAGAVLLTTGAGSDVEVRATDDTELVDIVGAVAAAESGTAAGVSIDVTVLDKDTQALIEAGTAGGPATSVTAVGNVVVDADASEDTLAVVVNAGLAGDPGSSGDKEAPAGAGTGVFHYYDTVTSARVGRDAQPSGDLAIVAGGTLVVAADSTTNADLSAGSLALSQENDGYGAAVAILVDLDDTLARVGDGAALTARGQGAAQVRNGVHGNNGAQGTESRNGVVLSATAYEEHTLLAVGAAGTLGSDATGMGLSATVDVAHGATQAMLGQGASVNSVNTDPNAAQDVQLRAVDTTEILSIAGGAAIGGSTAIGGAVTVALVENDTQAVAEGQNTLRAADDVAVEAGNHGDIQSLAIGVAGQIATGSQSNSGDGKSTKLAGAGSGSGNTVDNTALAEVRAGGTLSAGDDLQVSAADDTEVTADAGGAAIGVSTGGGSGSGGTLLAIGASIAVNAIDTTVAARVIDSNTSAHDLMLSVDNAQAIDALTLAGSAAVSTGGDTVFGGAGSGSGNDIDATVEAVLEGGSLNLNGGALSLGTTDNSVINADAGSAAFAVTAGGTANLASVAVGAAAATNDVQTTARARLEDIALANAGGLSVQATSNTTIDAFTLGIAGSVAAGNNGTTALAGAGSGSGNTIDNTTEAVVRRVTSSSSGPVGVTAVDNSAIDATAGAATAAIGTSSGTNVGIGLGASVAINDIGNETLAVIDDSSLTTSGALSVLADSNATIDTFALGIALSVTAGSGNSFSGSGVGAIVSNDIHNQTLARIVDSSTANDRTVTAGSVGVTAHDDSKIVADAAAATLAVTVSGSSGGSGSVGVAAALNDIGNVTRAEIDEVQVIATSGDATMLADSNATIDALALTAGVSFAGASSTAVSVQANVSYARNEIANTVEAVVSEGHLQATTGAVALTANDKSQIEADLFSGTVSAGIGGGGGAGSVAFAGTFATNTIDNTTRAVAVDGDLQAGTTLSLGASSAFSTIKADANAVALSIGASGGVSVSGAGTGASVGNEVTNTIEAGLTASSTGVANGAVSITAGDKALIDAHVVAASASGAVGSGFSLGLSIAGSVADNDVRTDTRARVSDSSVNAGGALMVSAGAEDDIDVAGVAAAVNVVADGNVAVGASVTAAIVTNTILGSVQALIEDADAAQGRSVSAAGPIDVWASGKSTIDADTVAATLAVSGGGSAGFSGAVTLAKTQNTVGTAITAGIDNATVDVAGSTLDVTALNDASIDATTVAAGLSVTASGGAAGSLSGAGAFASNTANGQTTARIAEGSVVNAGGKIFIDADDTTSIDADIVAASFSVAVSGGLNFTVDGTLAKTENVIGGGTEALISASTVRGDGDVQLDATADSSVHATTVALSLGVSGGSGASIAVNAAAASAENTTTNVTRAAIVNATVTSDADANPLDNVLLNAQDVSDLHSTVAGVGISVGGGSAAGITFSAALALSDNEIGSTTVAEVVSSDITSTNGKLSLQSSADTVIDAHGVAAAVSIAGSGGFSVSGAGTGAVVHNVTTNTVAARISGSGTIAARNGVDIDARDLSKVDAATAAVSVGVALSGGAGGTMNLAVSKAEIDYGTQVQAGIAGENVGSSHGSVTLDALTDGEMTTHAVGVSVSLAGAISAVAIGGAGALADITTTATTAAEIGSGAVVNTLQGSVGLHAADDSKVDSTVTAVVVGLAAGAAGTATVTLSVAETDTMVGSTTRARIDDAKVTGQTGVTLDADSTQDVTGTGAGVSVSVAGGAAATVSGAGTAAKVKNTVDATTEALVTASGANQSQGVFSGAGIAVTATDDLDVQADALAAAVSLSGSFAGSISVAAAGAHAENKATLVTRAGVDASVVDANGGNLLVEAQSASVLTATPEAIAVSAAISLGGGSAGVAGAKAVNTSDGTIEAYVRNGALVEASGALTVAAHDSSDLVAEIVALAVSAGPVAAAAGVGIGSNTLSNTTSAYVQNATAVAHNGNLTIGADATQDIDTKATVVGATIGLGGATSGVDAKTVIDSTVQAYASGATLTAQGGHGVYIDADSTHMASADADAAAAGLASIALIFADAEVNGATRAFVKGNTTVQGSELKVTSDATASTLVDVLGGSIGVVSGAGTDVKAIVKRVNEAYVGTGVDDAQATSTSLNFLGGMVTVAATSDYNATATPKTLSFGVANVSAARTLADITGSTRAYIGQSTTVNAGRLDVRAASTEKATANTFVGAASAGAGAAAAESTAQVKSDVQAFVGEDGGSATALNVGNGGVTLDAQAVKTADADANGGSLAFVAAISAMKPTATIGGATRAAIQGPSTITAGSLDVKSRADQLADAKASVDSISLGGSGAFVTALGEVLSTADVQAVVETAAAMTIAGAVTVEARHFGTNKNKAIANAQGFAGGLLGSGAYLLTTADVSGGVSAQMDGDIASAGALNVIADGTNVADADTKMVNIGSIAVTGAGTDARIGSAGDVAAGIGASASVNVVGGVKVQADSHNTADAFSDVGGGGLVSVGVSAPTSSVAGGTAASMDGTIAGANALTVAATSANLSKTRTEMFQIGLAALQFAKADATVTGDATTTAGAGTAASIQVGTGAVDIHALSGNQAQAIASGTGGGAIDVKGISTNAHVHGGTTALLLGNVGTTASGFGADGVLGMQGVAGAGSISVTAGAADTTLSQVGTAGGGLATVVASNADAESQTTVQANFGSGHIAASGTITLIAEAKPDADAYADGSSVGGIQVSLLKTTATAKPTVKAQVQGGLVQAGGTLLIDARQGVTPAPMSDGTITGVDTGANTVSFDGNHGLSNSDSVKYDANGTIGGLQDERSYDVIVVDGDTIKLGKDFASGASIDLAKGTIHFSAGHHFESGDKVVYQSSNPITGLAGGTTYEVVKVDGFDIKLKLPGAATPSVSFSGTANIDAVGDEVFHTTNGHGFTEGQAVTYHAPPAKTFTSDLVDVALVTINPDDTPDQGLFLTPQRDAQGNRLHPDNNNIYLLNHGFSTGQVVLYHATGSALQGLTNDTYYEVVVDTASSVKLRAVGGGAVIALTPDTGSGEHSLSLRGQVALGGLVDGNTYVVHAVNANDFQLRRLDGSTVAVNRILNVPNSVDTADGTVDGKIQIGGTHLFAAESFKLTNGTLTGTQSLTIDLTGSGGGQMIGVGGPRSVVGNSGNGIVTSSSTGNGVGVVSVRDSQSDITVVATVDTAIDNGAKLRGLDVVVSSQSQTHASTVSSNEGGGFIDVGDSRADASVTNHVKTTVANGADIVGARDVKLLSSGLTSANGESSTNGAGFVSIADANATLTLDYSVDNVIAGRVYAVRTLLGEARAGMDTEVRANADTGGLGADADANDEGDNGIHASGSAQTWLGATADVYGGNVHLGAASGASKDIDANGAVVDAAAALVTKVRAYARSDADADGLGTDSDAAAVVVWTSSNEVLLDPSSQVRASDGVSLYAEHRNLELRAVARADSTALGGDTDSTATVVNDTESRVSGRKDSFVQAAELYVTTFQDPGGVMRDAESDGAAFDGGSEDENGAGQSHRAQTIFWESTVALLGEPNPELVVDTTGKITAKTRNVDVYAYNPVSGAFTGPLNVNDTVASGSWIVVDDVVYDESGYVRFATNDVSENSRILGNAAVFQVKDTWDHVKITNASDRRLVLNAIDVVSSAQDPLIEIKVDSIPFPQPGPAFGSNLADPDGRWGGLAPTGSNLTFDFGIEHVFARTQVEIQNLQTGNTAASDIVLDGGIENPIGRTYIKNERGNILVDQGTFLGIERHALQASDTDTELIRTNELDLDADVGRIGTTGAGRASLSAELVRFRDMGDQLWDIVVRAEAAGDLVLDLTANERSLVSVPSNIDVQIDHLRAGDDIDVVVHDSVAGKDPGDVGDVNVQLYVPGGASPLPVAANSSGTYVSHFRPDVPLTAALERILRAFGTDRTIVDSDYTFGDAGSTFGDVRAEDNIDIRHTETGSTVTFTVFVDSAASLTDLDTGAAYAPGAELDDGILVNVAQVFLQTNGFVTVTELGGDFWVGHVESTAGDVTLRSPARIRDANGLETIDVTGDDITMTAGAAGIQGGIGAAADFLEINVDRNGAGGVLTAHDIAAPTSGTYLDELQGDLRVSLVETLGDVSLRTVAGSVVDALDDAAADVLGRTIDIDANGGAIGGAGNDLEIDSRRGSATHVDDVGLEARDGIHLTETVGDLRLVMAHATTGDIRLTVKENAAQGDDFVLLKSGSARLAESNTRGPGNDPDADRAVAHGHVFAEAGSVIVRAGDNLATDENSEIVADGSVDLHGDFGSVDAGHGTTIMLRGRLVADANVTVPGDVTGHPVGTYLPSTAVPDASRIVQVWGGADADLIQFGDTGGILGTTGWGSAGYVFIGAKTRVHAGADEDMLKVYYLQDADVTTGPNRVSGAGHSLTLDGEGGTDSYEVYTLGSNGPDTRNHVISVLDSGAPDDGVDQLTIFGRDSSQNGVDGQGNKLPTDDIFLLRAAADLPGETGEKRPGYVALLHGSLASYSDVDVATGTSNEVQRINYDTGLNGRLTVLGQGGNDVFASDDATVQVTLDGGAGHDQFRIGQIFGSKRNADPLQGALLAQDVFPEMVATTRGWLSPGTNAPMVVHGGTGNDEFTVYANQAELRLEGDDDNDAFVVRAFAIAAVSTKDWSGDGTIDVKDLGAVNVDSNGDGVINAADADQTPNDWRDDVIVLDANGVASPRIGSNFSTYRPLDIRTGGGDDEVQYNVNAPVSIDGGTGFDKLVILGTEFADDFVVNRSGIYGAGLNTRYDNVEVVEVDGLEGDDQFFVQSTRFGVAYRVIGGLGSDAINVASDVSTDIVTRELEGASGAVDHRVTSGDAQYDGLLVDGFDYNVASATQGIVVVDEGADGFTAVREGGGAGSWAAYTIRLATAPTVAGGAVYVTVSAARSPQEEYDNLLHNPTGYGLTDGVGESLWLSAVNPSGTVTDSDFQHLVSVNGAPTAYANRAIVLKFDAGDDSWKTGKTVYVYAPDDTRSEGDRKVAVSHTVLSTDARFDGAEVRNVEVEVRDNDTPGVYVTQLKPGTTAEDGRTVVVEGDATTHLRDEVLVRLAKEPPAGESVVVKLNLDRYADTAKQIRLYSPDNNAAFDPVAGTITFTAANWTTGIKVGIEAWNDGKREDPGTAVIFFEQVGTNTNYKLPNLRSSLGILAIDVVDDEAAGAVVLESGISTQLVRDDKTTAANEAQNDDYGIRLTRQPTADVRVAVLTDGLADAVKIGGVAITPANYAEIGGLRATQFFVGSIVFQQVGGHLTLTRGSGADLGSFAEEGFTQGQLISIGGAAGLNGQFTVLSVADKQIVLKETAGPGSATEVKDSVALSNLTREGRWQGTVNEEIVNLGGGVLERRLVRVDGSGWLADGFLEGQRVRVWNGSHTQSVDLKIAVIRGDNPTKDNKIGFTREGGDALPAWLTDGSAVDVVRIAATVTFTSADWYVAQSVELAADPYFDVPATRMGVKVFPVSAHLLSNLQGPLSVEGGVTGADRSLHNGLKLPGEKDAFLIQIGAQPPESQQIDILNVFNDSSQQDLDGTMDRTTIRGFGMAQDLDFGALFGFNANDAKTFGESLVFPGGISYGKINFGSGGFATNTGETSIEVLNVMLGEGNDKLTITDTLKPGTASTADNVFQIKGTASGIEVFRAGFDWKSQGFLIGQTVTVSGLAGEYLVTAVNDFDTTPNDNLPADPNDNSILVLTGKAGTAAVTGTTTQQRVIAASDPLVRVSPAVTAAGTGTGGTLTRSSGTWAADGFLVGQRVHLQGPGVAGDWHITGLTGTTMTLQGQALANASFGAGALTASMAGPHGGLTVVHGGGNALMSTTVNTKRSGTGTANDPLMLTRLDGLSWAEDRYKAGDLVQLAGESFTRTVLGFANADVADKPAQGWSTWGQGGKLKLSGPALADSQVAVRTVSQVEALKVLATGTMSIGTSSVTRGSGSWVADGFFAGQQVWISGLAGAFTIDSLSASTLTLKNAALTPVAAANLTVFGHDVNKTGAVRVGGDHIVVTGGAGPDSPLVVYGDTSQDGAWYGGDAASVLGADFGAKPFNPFPLLATADNEDDTWVLPIANAYTYAGNDVIDASTLFAGLTAAQLPTVGLTAYGGAGKTRSMAARRAITSRAARATTSSSATAASTTSTATPASTSTCSPAAWWSPRWTTARHRRWTRPSRRTAPRCRLPHRPCSTSCRPAATSSTATAARRPPASLSRRTTTSSSATTAASS